MLRAPLLAREPLIVGDAEQPKRVLDCSQAAEAEGVRRGMTVRQALGLCPDAAVVPPDPVLYRARWEAILDVLGEISPEVEDEELGRAYLNGDGLTPHYGDEEALVRYIAEAVQASSGLEAAVGLATGKFPAFAATVSGCCQVVPGGGESAFLAPLALDLLPVAPEICQRLRLSGFETIGEVAGLTLPELQSQFGFEGRRLWQLVNGIDEEPLLPRSQLERVEAGMSFEEPVGGIDVMVAVAKQLLSRLTPTLRGRAARELVLQAELTTGRGWERCLVLREAVSETERLLFVLRSSLQNAPPPNAVRNLTLRLIGLTGEAGRQLALGERARQQRQVEESVRQLRARYGYSPVYYCVDVEPWSVIPEQRQILVEYVA